LVLTLVLSLIAVGTLRNTSLRASDALCLILLLPMVLAALVLVAQGLVQNLLPRKLVIGAVSVALFSGVVLILLTRTAWLDALPDGILLSARMLASLAMSLALLAVLGSSGIARGLEQL